MNTTKNLYLKVSFSFAVCILVSCKTSVAGATEISPLIGFGQESINFNVNDALPESRRISFQPNIAGITRLGLRIYDFDFGYSFRGSSQGLDPKKGHTEFFDLQLGYHRKNWGLDSFYQTYKGFYTDDTTPAQLHPELRFVHYGLMGRYALSEGDFSVQGLMDQSDPVRATSGKYYFVGGLRYHSMETPTSLFLNENAGQNPEAEELRGFKTTSLNLGVGAGKYWVSDRHFFIGALFDVLATIGKYDYETETYWESNSHTSVSYNLKIGTGYAGEKYQSGLSITSDSTTLRIPGDAFIRSTASRILIYLRTQL